MSFLSHQEQEQLKAKHRLERDRRVCDRIKALLLYNDGWSYGQIAKALLLSKDSIERHIKEYQASQKLTPCGGGSTERFTLEQSKELERHLDEHIYLYVKDIVDDVRLRWKLNFTISGMTTWLERHGFSYKKPAIVPGKADRDEQQKWIDNYHELKNNLSEEETVCFIDGVHPTHNVQPYYGWIRKGVRKEIPSNSGRSRINLTGIIDIISYKVFVREDKTRNRESTVEFFKTIEGAYKSKKKVHVFCDNARYYKNQDVANYLKTSKIELHFLPVYSPNLNPIERLWKWMKERVIYNTYYRDFCEFKSAVMGFFHTISGLDPGSDLGKDFRSRVRDKFRAVSAPC